MLLKLISHQVTSKVEKKRIKKIEFAIMITNKSHNYDFVKRDLKSEGIYSEQIGILFLKEKVEKKYF